MKFETERLVLRHFTKDDWSDLQEMAITNAQSEFAMCDHQWPTDDEGIQGACDWFSQGENFWAMEVKAIGKVVCFVNFNGGENGFFDIGHVMNLNHAGQGYEYEGLKTLYGYAFETMHIHTITAGWALEDKVKLEPLMQLGMKVVSTRKADAFDGSGRKFTACSLQITREEWDAART